MRLFLTTVFLLAFTAAAQAEPIVVDGVALGAPKADVLKLAGAKAKGDGVVVTVDDATSVEVTLGGGGKVKRIYATHRKGILPLKDFTQRHGEPVKRAEGDSIKYVFTVANEGVLTLEKVKGYPGFYVEAERKR